MSSYRRVCRRRRGDFSCRYRMRFLSRFRIDLFSIIEALSYLVLLLIFVLNLYKYIHIYTDTSKFVLDYLWELFIHPKHEVRVCE